MSVGFHKYSISIFQTRGGAAGLKLAGLSARKLLK
jgi:hypothetical protein